MSGLRYPGGKTRSVDLLDKFVPPEHQRFISPFVGGGSFEMHLAKRGRVACYDIFKPLVTYWQWLTRDPAALADAVQTCMPVSAEKFKELRAWLLEHIEEPTLQVAATYFVINRCSFSGATLSGGYSKESSTKRFTQSSVDRIRMIRQQHPELLNISVEHQSFEATLSEPGDVFIFADPPYYTAKKLYGVNGEGQNIDHTRLRDLIVQHKNWLITYDDCPEIRNLYDGYTFIEVAWAYGMNKTKKSNEIVILSDAVVLDLWTAGVMELGKLY